jgi:tetratricopeptide (TPR) repeat protein
MAWHQVAAEFRSRYRVNARVAMRLARAWTQQEVADRWTACWPEDPKTLKHVSYWEQWPAPTGHEPSLPVLARLARLYECSVCDLVADVGDYRPAASTAAAPAGSGVKLTLAALAWPSRQLAEADITELAQAVKTWGRQLSPDLDRRALLFSLSSAFALAAAAPTFERIADDQQRLGRVLDGGNRADRAVLDHAQSVIADCRRHGDTLGPAVTLQCVMAERDILATILRASLSAHLARQAKSAYAELTQLAGWLVFNLGDYRTASHYYDEARAAAHAAQDTDLVTYVLCTMSHLATWSGQPRVGIDHAVAAQTWAGRSGNPLALAYAADVTARAYASDDGQAAECDQALELEATAVTTLQEGQPVPDRWYFYDESFRHGTQAETSLLLGRPEAALDAARQSLALIDPANVHNRIMTQALEAQAIIRHGDGTAACPLIAQIARTAVGSSGRRIDDQIHRLRTELAPWGRTTAVRHLDEELRLYSRLS